MPKDRYVFKKVHSTQIQLFGKTEQLYLSNYNSLKDNAIYNDSMFVLIRAVKKLIYVRGSIRNEKSD